MNCEKLIDGMNVTQLPPLVSMPYGALWRDLKEG